MATVNEVYGFLDKLAPFDLQMDFDNAGFLVAGGRPRSLACWWPWTSPCPWFRRRRRRAAS